jgi:DNA-binding CsgD family transcriptional regulator
MVISGILNSRRGIDQGALKKACERLGEAVVDPATWPDVMADVCNSVGAIGAVLLQSDIRTSDVPRTASIDDAIQRYFKEGWHQRDLRARGAALLKQGKKVIADEDVVTPEEMRRAPYFNDLIYKSGLKWWAAVGFLAGSSSWVLSIQRTAEEGPFEEAEKRLLAPLSQRLTEVASLSTAVGRIALTSAMNALNAVCQPAITIDRFGRVLDTNPAAEALFDEHIRIRNRRLVVADARAKSCLEKLIDQIRVTSDMAALPCEPVIIARERRGPVIARCFPIHGGAQTLFLGARVLLSLTTVEPKCCPKGALLASTFGLTRAEARVASIIAEGLNPEGAAQQLGISKATARNQLRAVFAKTDTHRQGELVALLWRL